MHPSELKLGDIICFHTICDVPMHVAMYTGNIDGFPYVTHAVTSGKSGMHTTILKNVGRMDVFRPRNSELGARAAKRMLQWAQYRIPYDMRRAEWMHKISDMLKNAGMRENKQEPIEHILEVFNKEARTKFYERIKFAARRDTCPVKILDGIEPRGFTCVQAVILAYQVEELAPYVKTLEQLQLELARISETVEQIKEIWISDKHTLEEHINQYKLPESYVKYATALRDKEELTDFCFADKRNTGSHPHYYPSLVAWNYKLEPSIDEFIDKFDSCLNLPAKFCYTDALFAFMNKNPRHWTNMGLLKHELLPLNFSVEAKVIHRQRTSELELKAFTLQRQISRERAVSSPNSVSLSPRLSEQNYTSFNNDNNNASFKVISESEDKYDHQNREVKVTSPLLDKLLKG